jgi:hypothetical protein
VPGISKYPLGLAQDATICLMLFVKRDGGSFVASGDVRWRSVGVSPIESAANSIGQFGP